MKLTSHTLKIWERIIDRLRKKVSISEQQFGFYAQQGYCRRHFALRQLMEGQKQLYCVFTNLEKVYDRVPRVEVWNCLRMKEKNEKNFCLIQDMYLNSKMRMRCAESITDDFIVVVGLQKGSALSPFLIATLTDCLTGVYRMNLHGIYCFPMFLC
ncbi:uncharacterized protein LOC119573549 [Penaeus monodon]|uniref:uncharacterized protein LOC119573549 n=1 Tax=Penaeus monodon TaxID=6687 RepID=UPI0018A7C213|nr:uncharacterized protein LOC119573549 [Penaeus monodon]